MTNEDRYLSEERASAVWHRAAQLQAEAARRLEERSRLLASGGETAPDAPAEGFRMADVTQAAVEAGIAPEFVELAVAELESGAATAEPLVGWQRRAATRLLRTERRTLEASRLIARAPGEVFEAMQRVLPAHPYFLTLRDMAGDALAGGALLFDVPPLNAGNMAGFAYHAYSIDVKQLRFTLHPVAGRAEAATELLVSADLGLSVRRNWAVARGFTAFSGLAGGGLGALVGAQALALAGAVVALPAVAGAAALGGLAYWGYGKAYRAYYRKFAADLEAILQAVDVNARTRGAFAPPSPPRVGDDGSSIVTMITTST